MTNTSHRGDWDVRWQLWIIIVLLSLGAIEHLFEIQSNPMAGIWLLVEIVFITGL